MANIDLRPSYWASVSGGKDSLFMLKVILENPDKYPLDGVVHYELEIDYPFIKNVIDYMRSECEKHGIRFVTLKPTESFYSIYEKSGFPSRSFRWCNTWKLSAQKALTDFLRSQNARLVTYIGFCADETSRFKESLNNRNDVKQIYPLAEMGIEESVILEWAKHVPLFNGYYLFNRRCGCMFCPMQSMQTTAYLMCFYPEEYQRFYIMVSKTEKELATRYGREKYSIFQTRGNGKYDMAYRDRKCREKYLPRIKAILEETERAAITAIIDEMIGSKNDN